MVSYIYALSPWLVVPMLLAAPVIRGMLGHRIKWLNAMLLALSFAAVVYVTLMARSGERREIIAIPFYTFVLAKHQPEYYREMLMNIALFTPIGMFLPFALKKHNIRRCLIIAAVFSLVIELAQYALAVGLSELDDIIFNTVGTLLGSMSYCIYKNRLAEKE